MKKQLKSLLLIALFTGMAAPAWSQASTEGKDFWVANTIVCQPPTASDPAFPTIAVSAQKACKVTITDYAGNQLATANVAAGSWTRFGDNTAQIDPADYYLDPSKWYPTTNNVNATDVYNHADKINNYGLHITATENISVFVIMRTPQYSMDASNALPLTALQSEYYLQDFQPNANQVDKPVTMTTILATENNTKVDITPKGNTYGKNNNGVPFTITLNKGQTYYLISSVGEQLAGSHIMARDDKKIAVYVGSPVTRLPGGVAARDGLFEQMMPIDYWGTQFIATRSLQKDGNFIGITATQNGTELQIDGTTQAIINEGETYYIVLQGPADPYTNTLRKIECHIDQVITADAVYIETSCPAAVISYDTGNSFAGATGSEIVNGQGDPSSVWMSPIQQKINRITFGACYTKKTEAHFLNIVTETATCQNTILTAYMGQYGADWSNKLIWTQVPGNSTYSYARVQIGNKTPDINVFTLENSHGFIAHVYGNGQDESYAYSAGSAAVEQGVNVNGVTFTNGFRSGEKFCFGDMSEFDANVGTDEITRVDWYFGDGTSEYYGQAQTQHFYASPGWYDVTADLYGHQVCTYESDMYLGQVAFSFRVVRPDTIIVAPKDSCLTLQQQKDIIATEGQAHLDSLVAYGDRTILNPEAPCYEDKQLALVIYNLETEETLPDKVGKDIAQGYDGKWYDVSTDVTDTIYNTFNCLHIRHYHVEVLTCLGLTFPNDEKKPEMCPGEGLVVNYQFTKGKIRSIDDEGNNAILRIPGMEDLKFEIPNKATNGVELIKLPTEALTKPGRYSATIVVEDEYCEQTLYFPLAFDVNYPTDIMKYKFNNVMAIYKPGYGGNDNYEFSNYEWHLVRNDQDTILASGPELSVLYLGEGTTFELRDQVYVVLTDKSGVIGPLRSCEYEIRDVPPYGEQTNQAPPATKKLVNRQIIINKGEKSYNIYGQVVQ